MTTTHSPDQPGQPDQPGRRRFVVGGATAAGGLALGMYLPFASDARARDTTPEVNAWVVVKPDDTVVIRIARSEMGQGTLTGLAQLVAEELEADWSKVTTEYPTPGRNLARNRVWRNFSTGGSRGIRESHDYVRQGGAAARTMLGRAAAEAWGVAASECRAVTGTVVHEPSGRRVRYGQVAAAASRLPVPADVPLKDRGPGRSRASRCRGSTPPRSSTAARSTVPT